MMRDEIDYRAATESKLLAAMSLRKAPATGGMGCGAVFATAIGAPGSRLLELASLPLDAAGQRLVALRYLIANGRLWHTHFAWKAPLTRAASDGPERLEALLARVEEAASLLGNDLAKSLPLLSWGALGSILDFPDGPTDEALSLLLTLERAPELAAALRIRLRREAVSLYESSPRTCDLVYLATYDLATLPATTVGEGLLRYLIVADKGEMGVRAVRVAEASGLLPVVLYSRQDDANAMQVRLAKRAGGFAISLKGGFRESYANPVQIAARIRAVYASRFGEEAEVELARSALYPGYGPLAENAGAIQHFRRTGIVFVGPMQDVVERAGDKRTFRALAEAEDASAVTPGVVMESSAPQEIVDQIGRARAMNRFRFPGRLKAANGGGGRGQVVVESAAELPTAVQRVLGDIEMNGWGPGVMFEQNISETVHLEVQVIRDRYGNTRHFGMRDCSEQRASQKIQEEAPPAILRGEPELEGRMCAIAVRLADACNYVGACTVELMYKGGHFYLLEMNTRIQVEHPVSEEAHRIRRGGELVPLDLVHLQVEIARGAPIAFAQSDVVCTHVARELRINAESWRGDIKDSRDGRRGLFLPNAGVFDTLDVPAGDDVLKEMRADGVVGIAELAVRFDVGFEAGDKLVNKDPTFGKLIVSIAAEAGYEEERYELLRLACLAVLSRTNIAGRQVNPSGRVIRGSSFATNVADHEEILGSDMMKAHARGPVEARHVGWVVEMLRARDADAGGR